MGRVQPTLSSKVRKGGLLSPAFGLQGHTDDKDLVVYCRFTFKGDSLLHLKSQASTDIQLQDAGSPARQLVTGADTDLYSDQAVLHTCSAALPLMLCCGNIERLVRA